jgi:superfamily II DNA or RNA helicase
VVAGETVQVIAALPMGADAIRLIFTRSNGAVDQQIVMRADEPELVPLDDRPTLYDAPVKEFKLAAEALRIRLEATAEPDESGSYAPLPHQLDAVYKHLLRQIPLRFLLADDPGAGKTIMAGLFLRELQLRGGLDRCLIVTPGGLVEQWQQELHEKFGLDFTILAQDDINRTVAAGAVSDRRMHLIARMDQVARSRDLVAIFGRTPWNVVIVDEAHRMSARWAGKDVKTTARYRLGIALRDSTRHLLLMTATPHAGKEQEFQLFMRLLDPLRFEGRYREGTHAAGAEGLMLRRTKEDLLTLDGKPLFPKRATYTVQYDLSPDDRALYDKVTEYVRMEFDRAESLDGGQRTTVGLAMTVLQRRLASSPHAITGSLERRRDHLQRQLEVAARPRSGGRDRRTVEVAAVMEEFPVEEREEYEEEIVSATTAARTPEELRREILVLDDLVSAARHVRDSADDRKWSELRRLLQTAPQVREGDGAIRKIIVFTEHRDTLNYLVMRTRELLGQPGAVVSIHGAMNRGQRLSVQRRFTTDPQCWVMIATDAAGEGLNLQVAHLMVNYDLPWNPNRLEQRFGRIHRIGQREMCHLWNLVAVDTREGAVYERLLAKLAEMGEALGGKIFDVLGEVFEDVPLHHLLIKAVRCGDDPKVRRHLETVIDESVSEVARRLIEAEALSPEVYRSASHVPYQRDVQLARTRRLQPHFVEGFFRAAFGEAGGRLIQRFAGRWEIPHIPGQVRDFDRSVSLPVRYPLVCFDPALVEVDGQPPAELPGLGHALFDLVLRYTESTYSEFLLRGATLIDREDFSERPRLLAAIQTEIQDGDGDTVDRRFGYHEIDKDNHGRPGTARFLNYDQASSSELAAISELPAQLWLTRPQKTAEDWATAVELPPWYAQIHQWRRGQAQRARELVTDRLKQEIGYWEEQTQRADTTTDPEARARLLRNATAEVRRLRRTLERRLAELERQESTRVLPPRVLAVALVIPAGLLARLLGQPPVSTEEIELRALDAVEAEERKLGRVPRRLEPNNPGFDVTSLDETTGTVVSIEVKGRIAGASTFFVTNQEVRFGQNAGDQYRLALVEVSPLGPAHDVVRYVGRPFENVSLTSLVRGVQFEWPKTWAAGRDPW